MSFVPTFEIGIWNAWIFMIWLLIQNLVIMFNKKLYHRFGGSSETKPDRVNKTGNIYSTLLWLLSTVYSVFLPLKLGTIWFPIGLFIFLSGLAVIITAAINFTATPESEVVTRGAYRFSRHPLYSGMLLVYLSIGIASASWIFLLITIIWAVLFSISAKGEENYCLQKYGKIYCDYKNRTPKWIGIPFGRKLKWTR